jgi:hypothetical protein
MGCLRRRTEIDHPNDLVEELAGGVHLIFLGLGILRTMTMERRMKPAADASLAGSVEYTNVFTMAVAYVRPAARNPTTCQNHQYE